MESDLKKTINVYYKKIESLNEDNLKTILTGIDVLLISQKVTENEDLRSA